MFKHGLPGSDMHKALQASATENYPRGLLHLGKPL
jgi:hypothetical protein